MKKVLFLTTYASPYRVEFFDELAKYCDVTVAFSERGEVQKRRDQDWFFRAAFAVSSWENAFLLSGIHPCVWGFSIY